MKIILFLSAALLMVFFTVSDAQGLILGHPLEFWDGADMILDGIVISTTKIETSKLVEHNIKVEQYFKNPKPQQMITVYGPDVYNEDWFYPKFFNEGERALFYLKKVDNKYVVLPHSILGTEKCSPRDMIGLSTLPGEPIGRGGPTLFFDPYQTCNGYLFPVWYLAGSLTPLKQVEAGIKIEDIKCREGFYKITKSLDGKVACVRDETKARLIGIGWMKTQVDVHDELAFIDSTKDLDEVRLFLTMHPDAKVSVNHEWYTVTYEESGFRKHPSSSTILHTKRLIIGLDYDGKPAPDYAECGGPVSLVGPVELLTNADWCFPLDQTPFASLDKIKNE